MRGGNRLNAVKVKTENKPGLHCDGHGLYLQVTRFWSAEYVDRATGKCREKSFERESEALAFKAELGTQGTDAKISPYTTRSWLFRYMMDGRARKMGLGAVHTVSLAEARKRAADARLRVHDGIDPIDDEKARRTRLRLEAAKAMTFRQMADAYVEAHCDGWKNDKHKAQWLGTFTETKRGAKKFPAFTALINDLPVSSIDTDLVLKVLRPIWSKTPETASRVRGRIAAVLDMATALKLRQGDNPARWKGNLDTLLPARAKIAPVNHHDAVPYSKMPAFMAVLRAKAGVSARALEFTILTAARTGEVIGAKWNEIDFVSKLWTVPAERIKAGREHLVPLSDRALAILADLPREGEHVFPGARKGAPLSNNVMLELVRGMRGKGATVHGFRSTFRDWAGNETNFPRELAEHALAHSIGDKAEQAYRRETAAERRRKLMAAWAAYCSRPPASGDNVVTIRERAS